MYVLPPVPRCSDWASSSLISPSRISLPRSCSRVCLHIDLFGACSAFTRVAARTLAPSPICDQLHRRLQPFRHLHDCSGCFRLERSPGGALTHWKAPPSHGARKLRSLLDDLANASYATRCCLSRSLRYGRRAPTAAVYASSFHLSSSTRTGSSGRQAVGGFFDNDFWGDLGPLLRSDL